MEWTANERATMGTMWLLGAPRQEIAHLMGVTLSALRTKAGRLGLPDILEMNRSVPAGSMRPCMCCEEIFYSFGRHNRLCRPLQRRGVLALS